MKMPNTPITINAVLTIKYTPFTVLSPYSHLFYYTPIREKSLLPNKISMKNLSSGICLSLTVLRYLLHTCCLFYCFLMGCVDLISSMGTAIKKMDIEMTIHIVSFNGI